MGFFHHTFSDEYAHRDNWLTSIDVRVKLLYLFALLIVNVWSKNMFASLFFLMISFVFLLSIHISPVSVIRCMVLPASFAVLILIMKGLHEGETKWISFSVIGYKLVFKEEGLRSGLHVCSKVMGGISLVILFSFTTTLHRLNAGLQWFRVPGTVIELLSFVYRYIFLLLDEVSTMWTAQKTRLGHISWRKTITSFGSLGGLLLIRAFDRAERTHEAMSARGYDGGSILTCQLPPLGKSEIVYASGMVFLLPVFVYIGNMNIW